MATKNKKDIVTDLVNNIYTNTNKEIKATMVKKVFSDFVNSMSVNITVAQLQAEDESAEHSWVNIIDVGKWGIFYYDPIDTTTTDDGGGICILTSTNKRYKRLIDRAVDARWFGNANYYFNAISDATTAIKAVVRFVGMEVAILNNGSLTTYWWIGGTADNQLVIKTSEPQVWDFTVGDGGTYTPADGATEAVNPALAGRTILGFWVTGRKTKAVTFPTTLAIDEMYGQFKPTENKMIIKNGVYTDANDYSVMFK